MSKQMEMFPASSARARSTDPDTSHEAAASFTEVALRANQTAVLCALREFGPLTDAGLVRLYEQYHDIKGWPRQSRSGLRTRRRELCDFGLARYTGHKVRLPSGKLARVWRAT